MPHVFLSYSRQDVWVMRFIKSFLRAEGLTIWVDEKLVLGTPDWQLAIQKAIRHARCMIVILTPEAAESEWVGKEIHYAQLQHLNILPVLASGEEKDSIPFTLSRTQWIDIRYNCEAGMRDLVTTVKKQPGITAARFRPSEINELAEIRWDRLGSLIWFTSDCQNLIDRIQLTERVTTTEMKRYLEQTFHHAKRLNYSDGMETTKNLLDIIGDSRGNFGKDTEEESFENYVFLSHWVGGLIGALRHLARQAQEIDPDYEPGPMWREPYC